MSVDYILHVKRNKDDKEIGRFYGNQIKGILDSGKCELIHCDGRSCDKAKFTTSDLDALYDSTINDMKGIIDKIIEKKLMIVCASSVEIKHDLEMDINELHDSLTDIHYVLSSISALRAMIDLVTEDMLNSEDKIAYEYNAEGLPKEIKHKMDGTEYEHSPLLWSNDVYCEVEANW